MFFVVFFVFFYYSLPSRRLVCFFARWREWTMCGTLYRTLLNRNIDYNIYFLNYQQIICNFNLMFWYFTNINSNWVNLQQTNLAARVNIIKRGLYASGGNKVNPPVAVKNQRKFVTTTVHSQSFWIPSCLANCWSCFPSPCVSPLSQVFIFVSIIIFGVPFLLKLPIGIFSKSV